MKGKWAVARPGAAVSDTPAGAFHHLGCMRPNTVIKPLNTDEHPITDNDANSFNRLSCIMLVMSHDWVSA